jgi:serine/threonine-protein kinase
MRPQVGNVIHNKYRLLRLIGDGGMGAVFEARHEVLGTTVALKFLHVELSRRPGLVQRFLQEARVSAQIQSPNVVRVTDVDQTPNGLAFIVMELLDGKTLQALYEELYRAGQRLSNADALEYAIQMLEGASAAHKTGIVHRDLKPDNVMICNDGTIRIMDFGIAKFEGQRRLTFGGFTPAMGTPDYMAPEQVKGKRGDPRTDVYSMGAILYEMVTGFVPFEGANPFIIMNSRISGDPPAPRSRNANVTPQVEEIILHAMSRNPMDRYESALALKDEMDHPEAVQVTGRAQRLVTPSLASSRGRKVRLVVLPIVIIVLLCLAFYLGRKLH